MLLSIIIPIYNEEDNICELLARVDKLISSIEIDTEVVIVNDGSVDGSINILKTYLSKLNQLKIVNLSRNFGHQSAYMAGLSQAQGDATVMLDGDLQDPPELIKEMIELWRSGYQTVVAARKSRKDPFFKKILIELFHKIFTYLSDYPIAVSTGMFSLMDKKVVRELLNLQERNRFIPGLREWLGFKSKIIWYDRDNRSKGDSKQNFTRLLRLGFDAIFSFSYKPLRISLFFGLLVSFFSFSYASILFIQRIFKIDYVKGFTTPTVAIFFLSGVILVSIGIIGEYLGRIYDEVKKRPHYIISEVLSRDQNG